MLDGSKTSKVNPERFLADARISVISHLGGENNHVEKPLP